MYYGSGKINKKRLRFDTTQAVENFNFEKPVSSEPK